MTMNTQDRSITEKMTVFVSDDSSLWSSGKLLEIQESKNILTIRRAYQIDWKAFLPILSYFIKTKQTHHEVVIKFCFRVSILNQMNEVVRRISSLILKVLLFKLLWYEFAWFLTSEWMMSMIPRKFWVSLFSFFNTLLSFSLLFFVEDVAFKIHYTRWWFHSGGWHPYLHHQMHWTCYHETQYDSDCQ